MSLEPFATSGTRSVSGGALARLAATGIYLLRGIPHDLQRAARARAVTEGTTLRWVLLRGLHEYAAATWTPRPDRDSPESSQSSARARLECLSPATSGKARGSR